MIRQSFIIILESDRTLRSHSLVEEAGSQQRRRATQLAQRKHPKYLILLNIFMVLTAFTLMVMRSAVDAVF